MAKAKRSQTTIYNDDKKIMTTPVDFEMVIPAIENRNKAVVSDNRNKNPRWAEEGGKKKGIRKWMNHS